MPIDNVNDTSTWEDWQREYLHGAFYIFPPDDIIEPVDALRDGMTRARPPSARHT